MRCARRSAGASVESWLLTKLTWTVIPVEVAERFSTTTDSSTVDR